MGSRKGSEHGPLKPGGGVLQGTGPQLRGQGGPSRSRLGPTGGNTGAVLKKLMGEVSGGGLAPGGSDYRPARAPGQFALSKDTAREWSATVSREDEAWRPRELRHEPGASLLMDPGDEPSRRWGQETGVRCVRALGAGGRQGRSGLSTTKRERYESCLGGWRGVGKRGRPPPGTITPEGAGGLTEARAARGPKAERSRCGFHKMPDVRQEGPARARPALKALGGERRAAPTRQEAAARRAQSGAQDPRGVPQAWRGLLDGADAARNPLAVPQRPPHSGRTATPVERALVEGRRRTEVSPQLFDGGRLVTLGSGVLIRVRERWDKKSVSDFEQHPLRSWRRGLELDEQEGRIGDPQPDAPSRRSAASAASPRLQELGDLTAPPWRS